MPAKPKSRKDRDLEKSISREEFVLKLRRLADALETGKPFVIQVGGERIRLPKDAVLSIEHEREKGAEELEFQVKWKRAAAAARTTRRDD
ncbi:MAG TPA: amphi-Trp domain-containing protein [Verrucomicrobiae bacterium]|nr:amphi-Trp domain-containing protein [Verrucomicrobiae bacterium]